MYTNYTYTDGGGCCKCNKITWQSEHNYKWWERARVPGSYWAETKREVLVQYNGEERIITDRYESVPYSKFGQRYMSGCFGFLGMIGFPIATVVGAMVLAFGGEAAAGAGATVTAVGSVGTVLSGGCIYCGMKMTAGEKREALVEVCAKADVVTNNRIAQSREPVPVQMNVVHMAAAAPSNVAPNATFFVPNGGSVPHNAHAAQQYVAPAPPPPAVVSQQGFYSNPPTHVAPAPVVPQQGAYTNPPPQLPPKRPGGTRM